jgi:hypothetical protein
MPIQTLLRPRAERATPTARSDVERPGFRQVWFNAHRESAGAKRLNGVTNTVFR